MYIYIPNEDPLFESLKTYKFNESDLPPWESNYIKEMHPMYGQKHTEETLTLMSKSHMGERNSMYGITGNANPNYGRVRDDLITINKQRAGRKLSDETKKKISDGRTGEKNWNYGKPRDPETIRKMSEAMSGEKNPRYGKPGTMLGKTQQTLVCPHCQKIGGISNMKRYHFDKCKLEDKK